MKAPKKISVLGYALLGLIHQKPRSGYDLRKIFTETAMGSFSNSPGAIYPALARLEKQGAIASEVLESAGLRRRRVFRITETGEREFKQWLSKPVTRDEIIRGMGELMLRFAFMEQALGAEGAVGFLHKLRVELDAYVPGLKDYLQQHGPQMPLSGMLALDSGIRNYETLQQWVEHAIQTYQSFLAPKKPLSASQINTHRGGQS
jgi:DNA-binding PadR family transcriptional regulator